MSPSSWILMQLLSGVAGGVVLLRWAVPPLRQLAAERPREARGLAATWLPLAVALPSAVAATRFGGVAGGAGAAGAAATAVIGAGLVALGVALVIGRREAGEPGGAGEHAGESIDGASLVAAGTAAVLLLVLAASRHLDVCAGQVGFATMALLLWVGGPPARPRGEAAAAAEFRCAAALLAAVLLAGLEAAAVRGGLGDAEAGGGALAGAAAGVLALKTLLVLGGLAAVLPASLARRVAVWSMAVGACGAVGVATLTRLPSLVAGAMAGGLPPGPIVAGGFGAWAAEAVCLAAAAAAVAVPSRGSVVRVLGGAAILAGLAVLAGWA